MMHIQHTLSSIQGHNKSIILPVRPDECVYPFVLPENEGNIRSPPHASSTTFGEDGSPSHEAHMIPNSNSSTVHRHADEHHDIRQSPAIAPEYPFVNQENAQRDNPLQTPSTRRDATPRVERAPNQSHDGMFNGAQGATINEGVFLFALGNILYGQRDART